MNEPKTVDDLLAEIIEITARINETEPGTEQREHLEARREALRSAARLAGDRARPDAGLLNELGTLNRRLAEIDARPIGKSFMEKTSHRWFNDPGAYSSQINRMIDGQDEDEREALIERIQEIKTVLASRRPSQEFGG